MIALIVNGFRQTVYVDNVQHSWKHTQGKENRTCNDTHT